MLEDKLLIWKFNRDNSRRINMGYRKDRPVLRRWGFAARGIEYQDF
ncbi:MAG TPA: hypothetical protein VMY06_08195 [Sedimentisphaerales bacterium]|nr:hypothetical protein [Sedimentisphaerales bacterium]